MKQLLLSLLLVLLTLGTSHLLADEPTYLPTSDPKDSTTESVTEHAVTLTVTCPKVILPGFGNYVLMTVRNDSDKAVTFMATAPHNLGVRFGISLPDEGHQWTTISLPAFEFTDIEKGQAFKVLVYPIRYEPHLKPGHYQLWARWEGTQGNKFVGDKKIKIVLDTKPIGFEYQGKSAEKTP